jgi:glycosyltransferase involved in cell wall biosynthesis
MTHIPTISVITIVYNGESYIERTLQSVISQSYTALEYIIIDGQSRDKTLDIISGYKKSITTLVSEPDRGLYDAMNKGIAAATGEYIIFMNAGDIFHSSDTLEQMIASSDTAADIYYGETMMVDAGYIPLGLRSEYTPHILPTALSWRDMRHGMVVCHQAILVRRGIAAPYDTSHRYCADIDWIIRALKASSKTINTQIIVADYLKGGISDKQLRASLLDRFSVLSHHFGLLSTIGSHLYIAYRAIVSRKYF